MDTALHLQLLSSNVSLPDLSIGQAIDIAHIPQEFNEKRLSAMIGHLSGDHELAGRLTAQERYYILLNHQATAQHQYSADSAGVNDEYFIDTVQADVPPHAQVGDMTINHLRGAHVVVLEGICENVADWLSGQMACQLSGDLSFFIGGEAGEFKWGELPASMSDTEINQVIQERVKVINDLSISQFNDLVNGYNDGVRQLAHFVALGSDNQGLTLCKQGGDGVIEPARFLTLDHLSGAAARIAECLVG